VLALLALVALVHGLVLEPGMEIAVLYAFPILLAAWLLAPPVAAGFAVLSVTALVADATADGTAPIVWMTQAASLGTIAALGVWGAEQARRGAKLASQNAELAATREREAERVKALYQRQEKLLAELEQARIERDQFLGMVSHELKGALTVISGYAQLAGRCGGEGQPSCDRVAAILPVQVKRLGRLVDDLQNLSRLQRGRFELNRVRCDLVSLARRVVEEQQETTLRHSIEFRTSLETAPGLWDCDRLSQVVGNLVANAINYSPHGGDIVVSVDRVDGEVELQVRDHGIGMSPEDIPRLFSPYSRLERTRQTKGSGLGLYICKQIVEAHGGRIGVESALDRGSTFTVRLPLALEPEPRWAAN